MHPESKKPTWVWRFYRGSVRTWNHAFPPGELQFRSLLWTKTDLDRCSRFYMRARLAQPSNTTKRIVPTARLWNQEKKILVLTGGIIDGSSRAVSNVNTRTNARTHERTDTRGNSCDGTGRMGQYSAVMGVEAGP